MNFAPATVAFPSVRSTRTAPAAVAAHRPRWRHTLSAAALLPVVAVLALLAIAVLPGTAQAFCGFYAGKADASLFNEASQVVLVRDGNRTVLSMLNDYSGPLNEFALVVPTPTVLQQGQVRVAEKTTFERLDAYSSPRLAEYHDSDPCRMNFWWGQNMYPRAMPAPMAAAAGAMRSEMAKSRDTALGVTVEAAYTLEEYDIVSLSAKQSDGLEIWLRENGYKIPKGASAALKPYINMGMKFFVAKVNLKEQQRLGYSMLRPLQFAFESEKFMLPMRLGMLNAPPNKPQDLIVYVLTKNGRVESSNYRTVKLAANENLPPFIKPKFKEFYKALYDSSSQREDYRVVFTEYFWDMGWCDPCAANPLSTDELRKAGVFWVGGDEAGNFQQMQIAPGAAKAAPGAASTASAGILPARPMPPGGAQPVMLTRLHVRYTANTFPEDLMFTQTKDKQNFQTRYVIQNPYAGSVAACTATTAKADCETMCRSRVGDIERMVSEAKKNNWGAPAEYANKSPDALQGDCLKACSESKRSAIETATRYYERELPERLVREKQTLAKLTGWSLADIDRMGADSGNVTPTPAKGSDVQPPPATDDRTWWQKLFGMARASRKASV